MWAPFVILADLLAVLLDTPRIREEMIKLAQGIIVQREKTQIIGNTVAQILEGTRSYLEDPPVPPREVDGLHFHAGENLCRYIATAWSIPNLRLETVSRVLKHYGIVKEVRRLRLKKEAKGKEVEVQRSCYVLDEEKLAKLTTQHEGGKDS